MNWSYSVVRITTTNNLPLDHEDQRRNMANIYIYIYIFDEDSPHSIGISYEYRPNVHSSCSYK